MRFELRGYQEGALRELFEKFGRMLKSSEQKTCVFDCLIVIYISQLFRGMTPNTVVFTHNLP